MKGGAETIYRDRMHMVFIRFSHWVFFFSIVIILVKTGVFCVFDSQASMSGGEMEGGIGELLPPGVAFRPNDEQMIDEYLNPKLRGENSRWVDIIPEVDDLCKLEPPKIPPELNHSGFSKFQRDERGREWFFFSRLQKLFPKGRQVKRTTSTGFWKPTGKKRLIWRRATGELIGEWKTLVFHVKCGTEVSSTGWVIHQYCTYIPLPDNRAYVLCHLKRNTVENIASDIPTPDNAGAGTGIHQNGIANNMTLGAGPSHHSSNIASDIGNYQVKEMTFDEYCQLEGLLNGFTCAPPGSDWFPETEQGLDLDIPPPSGFNNSYGSVQFQDEGDIEFADSLIADPDECHCEGLIGQGSTVGT